MVPWLSPVPASPVGEQERRRGGGRTPGGRPRRPPLPTPGERNSQISTCTYNLLEVSALQEAFHPAPFKKKFGGFEWIWGTR